MAVAALVLSLLAIIIAAAAAFFTRRQAKAAEKQLHIATAPNLEVRVAARRTSENKIGDLWVRHVSGPDLDGYEIEIVTSAGSSAPLPVTEFAGSRSTRVHRPGLRQGEQDEITVTLDPAHRKIEAVFRLECSASRERWVVTRQLLPEWEVVPKVL